MWGRTRSRRCMDSRSRCCLARRSPSLRQMHLQPSPLRPSHKALTSTIRIFGLFLKHSKCGVLSVGLTNRTRYGFGPGSEEIQFANDGTLWAVFEAGSSRFPNPFFPVIARFDVAEFNEGLSIRCGLTHSTIGIT